MIEGTPKVYNGVDRDMRERLATASIPLSNGSGEWFYVTRALGRRPGRTEVELARNLAWQVDEARLAPAADHLFPCRPPTPPQGTRGKGS